MTGGHGWQGGIEADGVDECRKAARTLLKKGVDLIKVMATGGVMTKGVEPGSAQLTQEEMAAIIEEAHKAGRKTATHAQGTQGIKNALYAGIDSIEHGIFLDQECIDYMKEHGTYLVPTLVAPQCIVEKGVEAGIADYMVKKAIYVKDAHVEIKKLFVLRKSYLEMPIKTIQHSIVEITKYKLYNKMSEEEVKNAVNQVAVTEKFKQAVLNEGLTDFLLEGNNNLTNGLEIPFHILSSVFKGLRRGETMAFAMPSNAGKSRFTINLSAYVAFVHKKKVLVISNEMSEEKMKLCLITTILNNEAFQKLHGQKIKKSEGE